MPSVSISRIIPPIASITLTAASLLFPFWVISMKAPFIQEPIIIGIYPLQGLVGDLQNLNIVNHYVGLGEIKPENIPELQFIPLLYALYILLIAVIAFYNGRNNKLFKALLTVYIILLSALPVYSYMWMYRYTHTIDPKAPIKLEPFDPPFFGVYRLANFDIVSYLGPAFFLPLIAAIVQIAIHIRRRRRYS
ncbi:MAG TPA: hypothetical protein EYP20_02520 [Aigarchaeota archaeon]|nr:hypothetical protein [Aigarchaeota archaeon]